MTSFYYYFSDISQLKVYKFRNGLPILCLKDENELQQVEVLAKQYEFSLKKIEINHIKNDTKIESVTVTKADDLSSKYILWYDKDIKPLAEFYAKLTNRAVFKYRQIEQISRADIIFISEEKFDLNFVNELFLNKTMHSNSCGFMEFFDVNSCCKKAWG